MSSEPDRDLNNLVVFVRVIQAGSFSAAGRLLGLPKSTVSRRVAALEEQLGTRLLQRTTRALHLTEAGQIYLEHSQRILAELQTAERALSSLQAAPRGLLRVTAPMGLRFLDEIFSEVLSRHPDLEIELLSTERNVSLVDEGFDLALRAGPLDDSSLIGRKLHSVCLRVFASPGYLSQLGRPSHPQELASHDCLVFGVGRERGWSFTRGHEQVLVKPTPRMLANEYEPLRAAAIAGHGVAVMPELVAGAAVEEGNLLPILEDWQLPRVGLYALYPSAEHLPRKVQVLLDLLASRSQ